MVIGTGASGGIGIGRVMLVREQKPVYERRRIRDTKAELKKLREAVESFVKATEELADKVMEEAGEKEAGILRGHIILLKDPVMISEVEKLINGGECAEAAVEQICNMFISVFSAVDDELTRQRAADEILAHPGNVPRIPYHDLSVLPVKAVRTHPGRCNSRIDPSISCEFRNGILRL